MRPKMARLLCRRPALSAILRPLSTATTTSKTITDSSSCTFVNLRDGFSKFHDHWSPKIVGEVNGMHVKLVKLEGDFDWHHHVDEDELFMVVNGTMKMQFRDRDVVVNPGEFIIVPRLVEHCPSVPEGEAEIMLFEPASTLNTGNVVSDKTVAELDSMTGPDGQLTRGSGNDYNRAKGR